MNPVWPDRTDFPVSLELKEIVVTRVCPATLDHREHQVCQVSEERTDKLEIRAGEETTVILVHQEVSVCQENVETTVNQDLMVSMACQDLKEDQDCPDLKLLSNLDSQENREHPAGLERKATPA